MFKSVKYSISVELVEFVEVKIWVKDDGLHYSKSSSRRRGDNVKDAISPVSVEEFTNKIESLRIPNWKRNYKPIGYVVLDGESWDVKYEDTDCKACKSSGINAYPANWESFLRVLSEVVGNVNID